MGTQFKLSSTLPLLTATAVAFAALSTTSALANELTLDARYAEFLEIMEAQKPQTFQFTNMLDISALPTISAAAGGATLIRTKNSLTAQIMAADLEAGHAYTAWWIIFNKPQNCPQLPCTLADLPVARGAVHYASGGVSAENGTLNILFYTNSGGPPAGAVFNPTLPTNKLVKNNGFKAEVHLVMVDHGIPALPDLTMPDPNSPGTWAWELTHPLPLGEPWVRAAIFLP